MALDTESERLIRLKNRGVIKRNGYAMRIRSIHALANRCLTSDDESDQLLVAVESLDKLLSSFEIKDNAILDFLVELRLLSEYSNDLIVKISELITFYKSVSNQYCEIRKDHNKSAVPLPKCPSFLVVQLPENLLPHFDGDIYIWPMFSDRFTAMVN